MSKKKNNYNGNKKDVKNKSKSMGNPAGTLWGKIIIFILVALMAGAGLISLIYLIITNMFS